MHKITNLLLALISTLVMVSTLSSCVTTPAPPLPPFDYEQTKRALRPGNNTIKGSAFLRQQGGGIVTAAGNDVQLVPVTAYSQERFRHLYGNTISGINSYRGGLPINPGYNALTHKTIADVDGKFQFSNVADGSYFCTTAIEWRVGDYGRKGGKVMKRVNVSGGRTVTIVVQGQ
jgi:hypothetical protein